MMSTVTDDLASTKVPGQDPPVQAEDVQSKKRPRDDNDEELDHRDEPEADATGEPAAQAGTADAEQPKLSRNQLRKQKRQKLREERREERKTIRKEKRHEKTARKRQERQEKAEELAQAKGIDVAEALKRIMAEEHSKNNNMPQSRPVPVAFVVDCDFEKYMRENELVSLASQITRSYSMNRTGLYQGHLVVSSWGGKLKERFDTVLKSTHHNWKGVSFVESDFVEASKVAWDVMTGTTGGKLCPSLGGEEDTVKKEREEKPEDHTDDQPEAEIQEEPAAPQFTPDSIIYLSADSPHTLDKLEPNTSYIIGGLVDRNREKNLCQRRAEEKGIRTAKLPIGEYMQMASRRVLATNHVVEIMSKWLETGDWGKAFLEVIPKRKGGQLKGEEGEDVQNEDADEAEGQVEAGPAESERDGEKQATGETKTEE